MNVFKEQRKKMKLTQKELADMLYLDQTTISKWELDKAIPDQKTLARLADIFGVSVDYLLGRDTKIENYQNGNLAVNEQFVTEYNHLFNDIYFNRYTKIYSLLNQEQRIYLVGVVYGVVEQFGIRDIG